VIQEIAKISSVEEVAEGIFLLSFVSRRIAQSAQPGQFVNLRVVDGLSPLLRRPFSICRVNDDNVELVFNIVGEGTRILASKKPGEDLDVLGPLGKPFGFQGSFTKAILVAGGLGVAPFPFLTKRLESLRKNVESFVGAATVSKLWDVDLRNVRYSTDDGSKGFRGTVVRHVDIVLGEHKPAKAKMFGCGPTKMLAALSQVARKYQIDCELSLEGEMACGVGICQGCPVERTDGKKKYALVCTEGPTFDCNEIVLSSNGDNFV
jgi:dihydroorotate dehydrogenase electron transfer subunit